VVVLVGKVGVGDVRVWYMLGIATSLLACCRRLAAAAS